MLELSLFCEGFVSMSSVFCVPFPLIENYIFQLFPIYQASIRERERRLVSLPYSIHPLDIVILFGRLTLVVVSWHVLILVSVGSVLFIF